jgi:hypothetical protein
LAFDSLVAFCVLGFILLGVASALPHYTTLNQVLNTIGDVLLVTDTILVLLADWRGFLTLNGRLDWRAMSDFKRLGFGLLYLIFGPLLLVVYLVQIARATSRQAVTPQDAQP